jgi:hypothetical protein
MAKVQIHDIVGKHISVLKTASEIFLVQAISFCLKNMTDNIELDVSKVKISEALKDCGYLQDNKAFGITFANVSNNAEIAVETANKNKNKVQAYLQTLLHFADGVPQQLFEAPIFDIVENQIITTNTSIATMFGNTSLAANPDGYVYFIAMILVLNYIANKKLTIALRVDNVTQTYEFAHVYILQRMGNRMLENITIEIQNSYTDDLKQRWAATVYERRLRGGMLPSDIYKYTATDKYKELVDVNDIRVGDVILYYKSIAEGNNTDLASTTFSTCEAGVVLSIKKEGIAIRYLETFATRAGVIKMVDDGIAQGNTLYTLADKQKCAKPVKYLAWDEVGIENATNNEKYVILRIPEGAEYTESENYHQWLEYGATDGDDVRLVKLSIYDAIYTTFCDQNISFDKERFIAYYYKNGEEPEYERRQRARKQLKESTDT